MNFRYNNSMKVKNRATHIFCLGLLFLLGIVAQAQTLPYEITNNSIYPDNEIFVAIVGITDGHVWIDPVTGAVNRMDSTYNTVQGPVIDGNQGPGENGKYANCFRRLSDIPNKTVQIPKIAGCRIMVSFKSQLYLYFFGHSGAPSGYSAPNLTNPTDPNQGIKFELIELTFNDIGLWCNTSRVDSYQYPMGLEVWGDDFYKKVGELKKHDDILAQWQATVPNEFRSLLNTDEGTIHFPTKVEAFPKNFMDGYINDIWSKYANQELVFTSDAGIWRGKVQGGNQFVFNRDSDGQVATIPGKPTTIEAMEGSGVMASGQRWDLVVQSQMVAAITRHAIDLNVPSGVLQNFGDTSKYYQTWPYNWYSKFFHQTDISFESQTYTFAYDDVYDQSATIHTPNPRNVKITLGGLEGNSNPNPPTTEVATMYQHCSYGGYAIGLEEGTYTRGQLIGLGIGDDDISSVKVQSGYQATLYFDDNFTGTSIIKTGDTSCLVNDGFNDQVTSIIISKINGGESSQTIEAENHTSMLGVQNENCSEGGQNVGYIDTGDWMAYANINFPSSGNYHIEYRVASAVGGGTLSADINAGAIVLGQVNIPNTGGWQNWTTVSHTVTINAGTYSFGLYAASGGWNINWIKITKQSDARSFDEALIGNTKTIEEKISPLMIYPNPVDDFMYIAGLDFGAFELYDLNGKKLLEVQPNGGNIIKSDMSSLASGIYVYKVKGASQTHSGRVIKQ
ncbi:beta-1,3-glucanase family protein [Aquimarina algiphila]|uniref:Carbohydrate-binding protein n=2 Tax=Aquimarina algiphila TaxID=2047982 RepID=A0A554VQ05_9FLAO|nr:beta-1,3-glucanase family protein [Aquimarina algiphila]TSE10559.1 carbohydrate-binding protein [Aquimarina algiphila]